MGSNNFDVVLADDQWGRRIHYQLRYQVFCLETGYEDPGQFPDGEEQDEWDDNSLHFLVQERVSGQWVAAMRLVLPEAPDLPIKRRVVINTPCQRDPWDTAEISRLCMVGHYRRRLQGRAMSCGGRMIERNGLARATAIQSEARKQQRTAEILQTLLSAAVTISAERGIAHWYMLITRSLAKILGNVLPMNLQLAGPVCSHRGERYPFLVDVAQIVRDLGISEWQASGPAYRLHSEFAAAMPKAVGAD